MSEKPTLEVLDFVPWDEFNEADYAWLEAVEAAHPENRTAKAMAYDILNGIEWAWRFPDGAGLVLTSIGETDRGRVLSIDAVAGRDILAVGEAAKRDLLAIAAYYGCYRLTAITTTDARKRVLERLGLSPVSTNYALELTDGQQDAE